MRSVEVFQLLIIERSLKIDEKESTKPKRQPAARSRARLFFFADKQISALDSFLVGSFDYLLISLQTNPSISDLFVDTSPGGCLQTLSKYSSAAKINNHITSRKANNHLTPSGSQRSSHEC